MHREAELEKLVSAIGYKGASTTTNTDVDVQKC